ncbi:MAG: lamin tail domain-containing protein, partial [Deltaproteobacteria bacterium]
PTGDGAPDGEQDGASQDISNEAIARFPDAIDSDPNEEGIEGADIADFTKRSATIGVSNNSGAGEPGSVVINEVVTDPQADWSDSIGGRGEPFDARPGTGVPQQDDQWIELFNVSDREIDLTGWTLLIHDSLPSKELLSDLNDHLYFTEGSSARKLLPGGYLVIGNPDGVMEDAVFLELRDAAGQVIDTVEIGADFEGDGLEDGAPDGENNGNASNPVNEAIARFPNGTDSDIGETGTPLDADVTDFIKRSATILTSNDEGVVTPGDVVINEVVTDPQSDWDGSSVTGCRPKEEIPFDWIPCTGQGARVNRNDQYIELFSKAAFPLKITGWSVVMKNGTTGSQVDTEYLNLVGTDLIEPVLRFSSPDDARTNTLSPGQFLVIGNPEGVMDDTVFIELRDGLGTVIDNVELGDNPEGDDPNDGIPRGGTASGTGTEAVQRTPNGTDSDPNEEGIRNADIDDFTKRGGTPARVNAAGVFPEIGDVVINEVVTDPQTNWSETNFDGTPSPGAAIQGEDEFIEFFIKKSGLDLTGWTVEVNNDIREIGAVSFEGVLDPNDTVNRAFQVMQYFGRGSFQDTAAGDYVVVGDPALEGSIGNNCFILLREPGRTIIDDVEIGDDPENDGEGDGAPQGQPGGGDANSPQNEAVARVPNGGDTDNDVADFRKQPVTLGASNERRP